MEHGCQEGSLPLRKRRKAYTIRAVLKFNLCLISAVLTLGDHFIGSSMMLKISSASSASGTGLGTCFWISWNVFKARLDDGALSNLG